MKVVEVRVLFRAPHFALAGFAWRSHRELSRAKRVRRSSKGGDGLVDQDVVRLHHQKHFKSE